jgi:peptidoglycan/LPS O-acetylase OafA/YrhL
VYIGHVGSRHIGGGPGWQLTRYGAPAVVVFFVLSGFVIGYVSDQREHSGREYAVARAARLYSVVIPALVLTAVLDHIGASAAPTLYAAWPSLLGAGAWSTPVSLLFLNEVWGAHILPGSNGAYWSLSYEAAYYVMFGAAFYLRGRVRLLVLLGAALLVGPRILALLPVWLIGLGAYHICARRSFSVRAGWLMFSGSILAAVAADWWARQYGVLSSFSALFVHGPAEIAQDYVLAAVFAANLIGFDAVGSAVSGSLRRIAPAIRWFARSTFALYLMHVPLILCVRALLHSIEGSVIFTAAVMIVPFTAAVALAQVTESRKDLWRQAILWALHPGQRPKEPPPAPITL